MFKNNYKRWIELAQVPDAPYKQLDDAIRKKYEGIGLAELMSGAITPGSFATQTVDGTIRYYIPKEFRHEWMPVRLFIGFDPKNVEDIVGSEMVEIMQAQYRTFQIIENYIKHLDDPKSLIDKILKSTGKKADETVDALEGIIEWMLTSFKGFFP